MGKEGGVDLEKVGGGNEYDILYEILLKNNAHTPHIYIHTPYVYTPYTHT